MLIRVETLQDRAAVEALHGEAFGDDVVPALVAALRTGEGFVRRYSLVADASDDPERPDVVGHVMLTRVPLEAQDGSAREVLCLSPLGVRPDAQGRGVGRALVEAACAAAEADGEPFVVLEGDPAMYSRFGFVAAAGRGLRRPSERTPAAAFQVRGLSADRPDDPALRGRVLYPDVFWELDAVGLPMDRPGFLDTLEQACRDLEARVRAADGSPDTAALATPVPACPGWDVADVVRHLGFIHRFVAAWVEGGRRPRPATVGQPAPDAAPAELLAWFAAGWRALQELLDERGADTPTATWSPWDATCGFWRRRMAHEAAIHALDVAQTLPHKASGVWWVPDDVALDGVDEVVRLWLGTRLGDGAGGTGELVALVAADRRWTVGLHGGITETHEVPTPADATVAGAPAALYTWLWGRGRADDVTVTGSPAAVEALRAALTRAMQ
ncbi:GNAT family N-acetyltransferase [Kineosporia sp. A_224]|uniref:GNAT family N-acetyltransferase n=1 Tax=Kineosporia sp. A_224 TaxID=1962180 RepID=UPI000B4BD5EA|nr:GNAT family N-acetyltransferase [Kineosporia sp. A_224]